MLLDIETIGRTFAEDMSSHAKLVFLTLVYHANSATGNAWPSRARIAKETGLGVTTVSKALNELAERALISRRRTGTSSVYSIALNASRTSDVRQTNIGCSKSEQRMFKIRTSDVRQANINISKNIKKEQKQEPPPIGVGENAFELFWQMYPENCPRKVDKAKCRAKYLHLRDNESDPTAFDATLLEALERWKESDLWTKDDGKYIRAPFVWLNARSWEDTPLPAKQDTAGTFCTAGYKLRLGMAQIT